MKHFTLLLILLLPLYTITSQPFYKGVVLKDFYYHHTGDTIRVYASRTTASDRPLYLVNSGYGDKFVSAENLKLIDEEMDYWEKVWFGNRAAHIRKNGWEKYEREKLERDYRAFMADVENDKVVLRDEFLDDYLNHLVQMIHPGKLIRPEEKQIEVLVLSSPEPDIFSFNCGTIVITTGKIASMESEKDLVKLLTEHTAHLVLEDDLGNMSEHMDAHRTATLLTGAATIASAVAMGVSNVRNDNDFTLEDVWFVNRTTSAISHSLAALHGINYSSHQISGARHHAAILINNLQDREIQFLDTQSFTVRITPVLKNLAWQYYYHSDYEPSRKTLDRLFAAGIEDEEDYLLLAKLYRATATNDEGLQMALDAINKAEESDDFNFVEVLFEKGMILMRMEKYPEAKDEFVEFISVTGEVGGDPDEIQEAREMVMHCNQVLDPQ